MEARETSGAVMDEGAETEKKTYKVTFLTKGEEPVTVEYEAGVTPYHEHGKEGSLLDIALNYGVDLQHACGGNCACTTCHVIVKEGEENLTAMDDDEDDRLYMADGLTLHSRLGCQAVVKGDVTVEIAE
ncbi:MAG TPA: 2Fe-2S iron-sulfur cluster-binding protein [Blastocatellia bacterium]|jgi:2Fe-2S ferredoxin|nr:2Fe-2S iron-sulfur cluster-binding protein [Blastocatellia bacterium]